MPRMKVGVDVAPSEAAVHARDIDRPQPHAKHLDRHQHAEVDLGVSCGVDGATHVRTGARGELGIFAWIILIVVAGFVIVFALFAMVMRAQHQPPQHETQRVQRTSDI